MTVEEMSDWLLEKKPRARVAYRGIEQDDIHVWDLHFEDGPPFHLGVPVELLEEDGVLAERLMELQSQGWLDQAGETEHSIVLNPEELTLHAEGDEEGEL